MIFPTINEFKKHARRGNLVPVCREIHADLETPVSTFLKLAHGKPYAYLLESVEGGEHWARYSFISWAPKLVFQSKGGKFSLTPPGKKPVWKDTSDPLSELRSVMAYYKPVEVEGLPRFWGGAVGYCSYEMVRFFEQLPDQPQDTLNLPDAVFMVTDRIIIFDHLKHTVKIVICADAGKQGQAEAAYRRAVREIDSIIADLRRPLSVKKRASVKPHPVTSNMSAQVFSRSIERCKEYIRAGDIFQVVFSQRFTRKTAVPAFDIYRALRFINPSPYMYYLDLDGFEVVGSSPEILVRHEGERAELRPIAGTCKRGKSEAEEAALSSALLADPKERAEHIMLVDLGRNDLARVCLPATVTVPQLMTIEKYSHVMHIVSSVIGTLKTGVDGYDLFKACFPAGTVSGSPKIRAMEIIDELEPTCRGPYAGALGYFSYSGNMDMAITIRTIIMKDKVAYVQAGAGIVADSVPAKEFQETRNKAAAVMAAIDTAEKGID